MVDLADQARDVTVDAVGPQSLTFVELLKCLRGAVGARGLILPAPGVLFPAVTWVLGRMLRDTLLTREEYVAMASGLADSTAAATGTIRMTDWIASCGASLGVRYAHEIDRHFRPGPAVSETDRPGPVGRGWGERG